jgi:hypothetical protein
MERALRCLAGGILSLVALIEAHPQAVKADLFERGRDLRELGTRKLPWDVFNAFIDTLQVRPESALYRTLNPQWMWGLPEMLAADIADSLRWLVWAKTEDARKKRNIPRPIPRPGVKDARERIGTAPVGVAEMNDFLGWEVE